MFLNSKMVISISDISSLEGAEMNEFNKYPKDFWNSYLYDHIKEKTLIYLPAQIKFGKWIESRMSTEMCSAGMLPGGVHRVHVHPQFFWKC